MLKHLIPEQKRGREGWGNHFCGIWNTDDQSETFVPKNFLGVDHK